MANKDKKLCGGNQRIRVSKHNQLDHYPITQSDGES